jgi:hypothetical protein
VFVSPDTAAALDTDVRLEDRGIHALKGLEGTWQLHAVAN